jgi:superfamily I DNA/RNA helicase
VVREVADQEGVNYKQKKSANEWATIMESASDLVTRHRPPAEILNWIVDKTGYISWVEKEEGEESIETSGGSNVREMIRVAGSYETTEDLLDFVDATIDAAARQRREKKSNSERVLLCSVHRSKGKEFLKVWVVGCNDGTMPHRRGEPEEERRIAYVAATRAKDSLTLSYVRVYATRKGVVKAEPSPYLKDAGLLWVDDADPAAAMREVMS